MGELATQPTRMSSRYRIQAKCDGLKSEGSEIQSLPIDPYRKAFHDDGPSRQETRHGLIADGTELQPAAETISCRNPKPHGSGVLDPCLELLVASVHRKSRPVAYQHQRPVGNIARTNVEGKVGIVDPDVRHGHTEAARLYLTRVPLDRYACGSRRRKRHPFRRRTAANDEHDEGDHQAETHSVEA